MVPCRWKAPQAVEASFLSRGRCGIGKRRAARLARRCQRLDRKNLFAREGTAAGAGKRTPRPKPSDPPKRRWRREPPVTRSVSSGNHETRVLDFGRCREAVIDSYASLAVGESWRHSPTETVASIELTRATVEERRTGARGSSLIGHEKRGASAGVHRGNSVCAGSRIRRQASRFVRAYAFTGVRGGGPGLERV